MQRDWIEYAHTYFFSAVSGILKLARRREDSVWASAMVGACWVGLRGRRAVHVLVTPMNGPPKFTGECGTIHCRPLPGPFAFIQSLGGV